MKVAEGMCSRLRMVWRRIGLAPRHSVMSLSTMPGATAVLAVSAIRSPAIGSVGSV